MTFDTLEVAGIAYAVGIYAYAHAAYAFNGFSEKRDYWFLLLWPLFPMMFIWNAADDVRRRFAR